MKVTFHGDRISTSCEHDVSNPKRPIWHIPEEVPVAFVYNRRNYSVMMATPADLVDYAVGFSLTENIIRSPSDILSLDIYQTGEGVDLRFKVSKDIAEKLDVTQRRRNLVGSASCGLCGLENADVLFRKLGPVADYAVDIDMAAMKSALNAMKDFQPLNHKTRTVHGALWSDKQGNIILAREDVGRHNALDKLIGAMAADNIDPAQGFLVMSSRCSYEIVEKAASYKIQAILSVSAPTAFALRKAKEAHMAIYSQYESGAVRLL